jgi:hypothetical protein
MSGARGSLLWSAEGGRQEGLGHHDVDTFWARCGPGGKFIELLYTASHSWTVLMDQTVQPSSKGAETG